MNDSRRFAGIAFLILAAPAFFTAAADSNEPPAPAPAPAPQPAAPDDEPSGLPRLGSPTGEATGSAADLGLPALKDAREFGPDRRSGPLARPLFEAILEMKARIGSGLGAGEAERICQLVMADGELDDVEADLIGEFTDLRISYGRPWRRDMKFTAAPEPGWAPLPVHLQVMVIPAGWKKLLDCTGLEPPPQLPAPALQTEEQLAASIEADAGPDALLSMKEAGPLFAGRLDAALARVLKKSWEADLKKPPANSLRMLLGRIYARGATLQGAQKAEWKELLHTAASRFDAVEGGAVPDDAYSWLAPQGAVAARPAGATGS